MLVVVVVVVGIVVVMLMLTLDLGAEFERLFQIFVVVMLRIEFAEVTNRRASLSYL